MSKQTPSSTGNSSTPDAAARGIALLLRTVAAGRVTLTRDQVERLAQVAKPLAPFLTADEKVRLGALLASQSRMRWMDPR